MTQGAKSKEQRAKLEPRYQRRVAVGLSGGVDSAVSAALLQEQGYDVTGVFLVCWKEPGCRTDQDRKDALSVALKLGIPFQVLDFRKEYKTRVVDYFYREYRAGRTPNPDTMCNREIKFGLFYDWALRLRSGHAALRLLRQNSGQVRSGHAALRLGSGSSALRRTASQGLRFDYVATGHYARIMSFDQGLKRSNLAGLQGSTLKDGHRYRLLRGVDERKDQSYFLYQLKNEQLAHILFPIGEMTKTQVRQEARRRDLPVATKPDSQGICFIGDVDVQELLRKRLPVRKGEVVVRKIRNPKSEILNKSKSLNSNVQNVSNFDIRDSNLRDDYEVIGEHDGVWFYTIGQRHGFAIRNKELGIRNNGYRHAIPPFYVVEKDVKRNRLVVGFGAETYTSKFAVEDCNWLNQESGIRNQGWRNGFKVRIRHGGALIPAEWKVAPKYTYLLPWSTSTRRKSVTSGLRRRPRNIRVRLLDPQRGVAPGQAAVFYGENDEVLGGGVIR